MSPWLLFVTSLLQAAPASVSVLFWTIAACAGARTLVFIAASIVALTSRGERAKRALALARHLHGGGHALSEQSGAGRCN